ncbi:MAG TPA: hypothetical protein VHZ25_13315 [Acidobacteriaceae bacterium]|nr:hypothetical protein [Acidobacteriaceae bacterium]
MLGRRLTLIPVVALLIAGCSSTSKPESSASGSGTASPDSAGAAGSTAGAPTTGGKAGPATYVHGAPISTQTTTATITDPSLNNITAATMTIPSGWKLEGIEMMSACTFVPWPVFRAYSTDGLMQYRTEPVFGWKWRPNMRGMDTTGCANISKPIAAANFLQYYLGTMPGGVHVVGAMAVPGVYSQWAQGLAANANQSQSRMAPALRTNNTADTAALRIEVVNGSFVVEERLRAMVECTVNSNPGPMAGGACWARVDVLTAPQGQLDALVKVVDDENLPHGVNTQQWMQAAMARQQREAANMMAALTAQEKQESQMLYNQFQQIMARSAAEHQQFMQQQESSFESAMNNANASMNAQTTAASDWVDYALDQQTVAGPGGPTKVSNQSQVWTNGSQWYQTDGSGADPNGVLPGNWKPAQKLHGNGQPTQ